METTLIKYPSWDAGHKSFNESHCQELSKLPHGQQLKKTRKLHPIPMAKSLTVAISG